MQTSYEEAFGDEEGLIAGAFEDSGEIRTPRRVAKIRRRLQAVG